MSDKWKRWRVYMDELEDLLRWMAQEIDGNERDAALATELDTWPARQRRDRPGELARRMADMPFFGEILRANAEIDPADRVPAPDVGLREYPTQVMDLNPMEVPGQAVRPPHPDEQPPPRLISAERALAQRTRSLVPVLDQMTVPRNASAVIRTAEALGLQEMHFIHAHGYLVPQRAVTKRCERWLDLRQADDAAPVIEGLRDRGYRILGADFGPDARPIDEVELTGQTAVVLGSEQEGVSEEVRERVDELFYIPTVGFTAYLNVSVAAAIALSTFDRRLREEGKRLPLDAEDLRRTRARWYRGLARGRSRSQGALLKWLHRPPISDRDHEMGGRS
jgi:tRNA (guanosine-2'-O-)-methyltransferase